MQPTRPWFLLIIAAASAVAAWLVVRATFANLPPLPWTAAPALIFLAVGETMTGRNLRARLRGPQSGKPLQPLAVPRLAAFARASSTAAAVFGGLAFGFAIYAGGSLDKPAYRHDVVTAVVTLVAAVALGAAALYLERSCRAPEPPSDDDLPSVNGQWGARP
jgi:peptidoglycan/LPS O-acetylase OafA/YrhL